MEPQIGPPAARFGPVKAEALGQIPHRLLRADTPAQALPQGLKGQNRGGKAQDQTIERKGDHAPG